MINKINDVTEQLVELMKRFANVKLFGGDQNIIVHKLDQEERHRDRETQKPLEDL